MSRLGDHGRPTLNGHHEPPGHRVPVPGGGTLVESGRQRAADAAADSALGRRATQTRAAILSASRQLFLDRGYAGTRIRNITDACGISRAGFYTYFRDKREVFDILGRAAYGGILQVIGRWEAVPRPCGQRDVEAWVREYFAFLDEHGAFIMSSGHAAPDDREVRAESRRMQMRVAWLLGMSLRDRQRRPTDVPEALGLAMQAMLDRSWYHCRSQRLPVADHDVVRVTAAVILGSLRAETGA